MCYILILFLNDGIDPNVCLTSPVSQPALCVSGSQVYGELSQDGGNTILVFQLHLLLASGSLVVIFAHRDLCENGVR